MSTILERAAAAKQAATDLAASAEAQGRDFTDEERATFLGHVNEAKELKARHDRAEADRTALADLGDLSPMPASDEGTQRPSGGSLGAQFVNSSEYAAMLASVGGRVPSGAPVPMQSARLDMSNALVVDPGLNGPSIIQAPSALVPSDLLSAITVYPDSSPAFKVHTATWTDAADVVAEGALKPEASLTWTSRDLSLKTVAQHIPVTNQALAHAQTLRTQIDTFLVNGIRARMQRQVSDALASASGVLTQAFDTDLRTTSRKALTKAQFSQAQLGGGAIGVLISATDAESLDLEAMASAFTMAGDGPEQVSSLWRTPLVVSAAVPAGFMYIGDLKQIELYTAGGIQVATGWINDQFVKNTLTIRAETESEGNVFLAPLLVKAATAA